VIYSLGIWDFVLIAVVTLQAATLAYVYHPRLKALIMTLPIPFTLATLAVGHQVDATNVLGLVVLLIFTNMVRLMYCRFRMPIFTSIAVSAATYCIIGFEISKVLPGGEITFWLASAGTAIMALVMIRLMPYREEQGHRSPMPVWLKLPAIACVIFVLVMIKSSLRGFMTIFPMVGVIAAYEARGSLWTMSRQIPIIMLTLLPLMITSKLTFFHLGLPLSLAVGWLVFLVLLAVINQVEARGRARTADEPGQVIGQEK